MKFPRELRWLVALHLCVSFVTGAVVTLCITYGMVNAFDRAWYQAGLDDQRHHVASAPGELSLQRIGEGQLSPLQADSADAPPGYSPESRNPLVRVYEAKDAGKIWDLLGASLIDGAVSIDEIVIDAEHAAYWSVGLGDRVRVIADSVDEGVSVCEVPIGGIARPYNGEGSGKLIDGQVLVPSGLCTAEVAAIGAGVAPTWDVYGAGGDSRTVRILNALLGSQTSSVGVWLVTLISVRIWIMVAFRLAAQVPDLVPTRSPRADARKAPIHRSPWRAWKLSFLISVAGALIGVWISGELIERLPDIYVQPALVGWLVFGLAVLAGVAQCVAIRRRFSKQPGLPTLSQTLR